MTKLPLVIVQWNDAWVRADEPVILADVAASHKPMKITTIGWLLRDDEIGISLANEHYTDDETYRGRTFIPRSMVITCDPYRASGRKRSKKSTSSSADLPKLPFASTPAE